MNLGRFVKRHRRALRLIGYGLVTIFVLCCLVKAFSGRRSEVSWTTQFVVRRTPTRNILMPKLSYKQNRAVLRVVNADTVLSESDAQCDHVRYADIILCHDQRPIRDHQQEWSLLRRLLDKDPELNLIDFNAGMGFLTMAVAKLGRHVLATEARYDNIQLMAESARLNDVVNNVQIVHANVGHNDGSKLVPRHDPDDVTNEIQFQKAVIKLDASVDLDQRFQAKLVNLIQRMDILGIFSVRNHRRSCQVLNSLLNGLGYKTVDKSLLETYSPDVCSQNQILWLVKPNGNHYKTFRINILSPHNVPSLLNYVKCITMAEKISICVSTKDTAVAPYIETYGYWKKYVWYSMEKLMDRNKDLGLIDIGAHIGEFTLLALAKDRQVLAVEIFYENIQRLCESIRVNNFRQTNMKLLNNAVSDRYEEIHFWQKGHDPRELNKVTADFNEVVPNSIVQTTTLNDLRHLAPRSAILRFDMAGFEMAALRRIDALLNTVDVVAIYMEWKQAARSHDCMDIVDLLRKAGYQPYGVEWRGWALPGVLIPLIGDSRMAVNLWPTDIVWMKNDQSKALASKDSQTLTENR